jgi:hypothetical protein
MLIPLIINPVYVRYFRSSVGWYVLKIDNKPSVKVRKKELINLFPFTEIEDKFGKIEIDRAFAEQIWDSETDTGLLFGDNPRTIPDSGGQRNVQKR